MKAYVFIYVLHLILIDAVAGEIVTNCESKVELRAVLLSCPIKDTGCDDDDPLSQAMAAEEAQIFQSNSKNYRSLKDEKERGFPNAVKDCKRKLIITLKIKNAGKIPCDDEYIVVDHVFDPLTGGRGRLLTPVVLKLRQEQMIQLYGLQFQRVVNSDPFEEEKESDKACSIDPENPTCGIAMYDGKPIPFSEGFCCSCDPELNTKRQLSTVSRGDSFLYQDSKLISQRIDRLSRKRTSQASIVNPGLFKLKNQLKEVSLRETNGKNLDNDGDDDDEKGGDCPMRGLSYGDLPNYLMEHDRKIICDKDDFLGDLCKLRDEKNTIESKASIYNCNPKAEPRNRVDGNDRKPLFRPDVVSSGERAPNEKEMGSGQENLNDALIIKTLMEEKSRARSTKGEGHERPSLENQVTRGKRENIQEPLLTQVESEVILDEKLRKFVDSKHLMTNRNKRLLKLPHERFRKAQTICREADECKSSSSPSSRDDYIKAPPAEFFFSHDKFIVHPGGSVESVANSTCRLPDEEEQAAVSGFGSEEKHSQHLTKEERDKNLHASQYLAGSLGKASEKFHHYTPKKTMPNLKFLNGNAVGEVESGKFEGRLFKGNAKSRNDKFSGEKSQKTDEKLFWGESSKAQEMNKKESRSRAKETLVSDNECLLSKSLKTLSKENKIHISSPGQDKEMFLSDLSSRAHEPENEKDEILGKPDKLEKSLKQSPDTHSFVDTKQGEGVIGKGNSGKLGTFEKEKPQSFGENMEKPSRFLPVMNTEQKFGMNRGPGLFPGKNIKYDQTEKNYFKNIPGTGINGRQKGPFYPHWKLSEEDEGGNVDFNFEIIRKPVAQPVLPRTYSSRWHEYLRPRNRQYGAETYLSLNSGFGSAWPISKSRQQVHEPFDVVRRYFSSAQEKDRGHPRFRNFASDSIADIRARRVSSNRVYPEEVKSSSRSSPQKYNVHFHKKPPRHFYVPTDLDTYRKELAKFHRQMSSFKNVQKKSEERELHGLESYPVEVTTGFRAFAKPRPRRQISGSSKEKAVGSGGKSHDSPNDFESTTGYLLSELNRIETGFLVPISENQSEIVGRFQSSNISKKSIAVDNDDGGGSRYSTDDDVPSLKRNSRDMSLSFSPRSSENRLLKNLRDGCFRQTRIRRMPKKMSSDAERLKRSYATAPDYVKNKLGERTVEKIEGNMVGISRENSRCGKSAHDEESTRDTAHCMRFGDMWYSVYLIKKPVVTQTVGVQVFDKHGLCDGSTQWRDLTKGKMIRIGTFLPKAEDELPTISMTYVGGKTKKAPTAIDPDNYLLLIPTHVSDPTKAGYYPQFDAGPEEYLVVDSKRFSKGGDCDMIGTSFEAFARQPERCTRPRGSCLKRQPVDLWREDMEARIRGKRGKYFVENFGTVANSPIKTYTNLTGEYLALEYYGEYTSTIEIELKADFNAMVRKGSNAQIPTVYIDGTYPKKTRIILSVLNIGLTSSHFRPRLGDCPPDLDPAWCPLEGPLVTIPPQQRHDFRLDLSGALPPNKIHVTVQVLNQLNKKVAYRKIVIKKGDRCICAFHCKCNCIGNADGRTCHRLALEDYRGAGYIGSYPFRGGAAASASESIRTNLRVIFLTAVYVLLLMGLFKGIFGIFYRRMGIAGIRVIVGPRKISKYYERELECTPVTFDDCGFPIHPTTGQPVQIVALWLEILINFIFFFLYPLRGIWFLLVALPCCTIVVEMCDSTSGADEGGSETDQKSSSPLLSKNGQPTCVNYTMTTLNAKQIKGDEYLPYLPYRGDDDPLEEDDTEFVLREMKRYRKKAPE